MTPVVDHLQAKREYTLEEKFQACVDIIHALPKTGPAPVTYVAMLAMYGLYKQVTLGPNRTSKPGFWNPEGRAKWDAWTRVSHFSKEDAMTMYLAIVLEAIDVGSETLDWNEMLTKYNHYYEDLGFLRENFRIIDRELVKEDGTQVRRARNGPTDLERLCAGPYTIQEKFQACVDIIRSMPKSAYMDDIKSVLTTGEIGPMPTNFAEMFTMYALYKQATIGQCNTNKPFWNIVERYKWEAWFRLGETNKEQAMAGYVVAVLEKIDWCALNFDWDEMLEEYADDYETLEPILREKFRILDRELIRPDGTRVKPEPFHNRMVGILSFNFDVEKARRYIGDVPRELEQLTPNDPGSDGEYCDVHEDMSRPSSSLEDPDPGSRSMKNFLAKMDTELRTLKTALTTLSSLTESRHHSLMKLIKRSSRVSWRSIFFFLIWPFVAHWMIKYFGRSAFICAIWTIDSLAISANILLIIAILQQIDRSHHHLNNIIFALSHNSYTHSNILCVSAQ
ncbi:hypothetical protein PRIPAC_78110 [Pristionchus pacificus]|uniref:Uncharacterized protein n=1 Tax=Pristionchus pacificus TaxID=54126 RepID=A0A2A6CMD4_PRIPA|nr:hypothetical protein PRIPAC_78110 [Pristionchus pacificus]|eukprot:PDM79364.1 hypothetical protein PRIPAC_31943 [Pristionchus pacificus]